MQGVQIRFIDIIIGAMGAAFTPYTRSFLIKVFTTASNENISPALDVGLWGGAVLITFTLAYALSLICTYIILKASFLRRSFTTLGRFEGAWIQYTGIADRPYSYSEISFDNNSNSFIYWGYAFDIHGSVQAEWTTKNLNYDSKNNLIIFYSEAHVIVNSREGPTDEIYNFGRLKHRPNTLDSMTGRVEDFGGPHGESFSIHFMKKLTSQEISDVTKSNRSANDPQEYYKLIEKYMPENYQTKAKILISKPITEGNKIA